MLKNQKERHDGGSRYIGTGGTSPFGTGGAHPSGIRVGGGGQRSAAMVADKRRFQAYRDDAVLDVRQFDIALRMLGRLCARALDESDIDESIAVTAKQGGEIDLVFRPTQENAIRLLLVMDVGGSMTPTPKSVTASSRRRRRRTISNSLITTGFTTAPTSDSGIRARRVDRSRRPPMSWRSITKTPA